MIDTEHQQLEAELEGRKAAWVDMERRANKAAKRYKRVTVDAGSTLERKVEHHETALLRRRANELLAKVNETQARIDGLKERRNRDEDLAASNEAPMMLPRPGMGFIG